MVPRHNDGTIKRVYQSHLDGLAWCTHNGTGTEVTIETDCVKISGLSRDFPLLKRFDSQFSEPMCFSGAIYFQLGLHSKRIAFIGVSNPKQDRGKGNLLYCRAPVDGEHT